eukprot:5550384-Lingulodinium_polyedra.AAC.1
MAQLAPDIGKRKLRALNMSPTQRLGSPSYQRVVRGSCTPLCRARSRSRAALFGPTAGQKPATGR